MSDRFYLFLVSLPAWPAILGYSLANLILVYPDLDTLSDTLS